MTSRPALLPLAGLVAGAAIVGVAWLLVGSGGGSIDKKPLTPPSSFGTLEPFAVASKHFGKTAMQDAVKRALFDRRSAALLSDAYAGAAATAASYTDASLGTMVELYAVRANSPEPFEPYESASYLGLVRPEYEVRGFGDVFCSIYNLPTPAPGTPTPDSITVLSCQRSEGNLTVFVHVSGPVSHNPAKVATYLDTAFDKIA